MTMPPPASLRVGVVGAGGRGGSFRNALHALDATVHAVCDLDPAKAAAAKELLQAGNAFTDYEAMLDEGGLQAVVIGTPMPFHVDQSIMALERGIHVLCEVTAGVTVEECKRLVQVADNSQAVYMLAENLNYDRTNVAVNGLVDGGTFGDVYYAEGEYLHDVKSLAKSTPWRRHWQMGIRGLTYCTHALGPIMRWMKGDRVVRVCCEDAGSHYRDKDGELFAGDASVMLAKTAMGRLIKVRVDLTSNRPYGMNFELQGTAGAVEITNSSGEGGWGQGRIAIAAEPSDADGGGGGVGGAHAVEKWAPLDAWMASAAADAVLPEVYRSTSAEFKEATRSGHNGTDFYVMVTFLAACRGEAAGVDAVGIHEAMDMTLPGLVSQASADSGGRWLPVPDSRDWVTVSTGARL
eukprot:SAG22_NODE_587_length_8857_cov_5.973167_4_plen_407_part_00